MRNVVMFMTAIIIFVSVNLFAAEKNKTNVPANKTMMKMKMTPEMRLNAAMIHEEMAICLRSKKTVDECRSEMTTSCTTMLGKKGCPMIMRKRMHGRGMMMFNKEYDYDNT